MLCGRGGVQGATKGWCGCCTGQGGSERCALRVTRVALGSFFGEPTRCSRTSDCRGQARGRGRGVFHKRKGESGMANCGKENMCANPRLAEMATGFGRWPRGCLSRTCFSYAASDSWLSICHACLGCCVYFVPLAQATALSVRQTANCGVQGGEQGCIAARGSKWTILSLACLWCPWTVGCLRCLWTPPAGTFGNQLLLEGGAEGGGVLGPVEPAPPSGQPRLTNAPMADNSMPSHSSLA